MRYEPRLRSGYSRIFPANTRLSLGGSEESSPVQRGYDCSGLKASRSAELENSDGRQKQPSLQSIALPLTLQMTHIVERQESVRCRIFQAPESSDECDSTN